MRRTKQGIRRALRALLGQVKPSIKQAHALFLHPQRLRHGMLNPDHRRKKPTMKQAGSSNPPIGKNYIHPSPLGISKNSAHHRSIEIRVPKHPSQKGRKATYPRLQPPVQTGNRRHSDHDHAIALPGFRADAALKVNRHMMTAIR